MKLLTAIASAFLLVAPTAALANPLVPITFSPGSYCGAVIIGAEEWASSNTLRTLKVNKGQTIAINVENGELLVHQLQVINPVGIASEIEADKNGTFIFTAKHSGSYQLRFYAGDSDFFTPNLVACVK